MHILRYMVLVLWLLANSSIAGSAQDLPECAAFPFEAPLHERTVPVVDVTHAHLTLQLDRDGATIGSAVLDLLAVADLDSLTLRLPPGHGVDSVRFGDVILSSVDAPASHEGGRSTDARRASEMRFALGDTVAADSLARLVVYFQGRLDIPADGVVAALDPLSTWFPIPSTLHDRFTSTIELSIPNDWSAAATGIPVGRASTGPDGVTYRFESPQELPARRIGIVGGLVDFGTAFATLRGGRRVPVTWWTPETHDSDVPRHPEGAAEGAARVLAFLSDWTGFPLPFEGYTQVHVDGEPEAAAGLARVPPLVEPNVRSSGPYVAPAELKAAAAAQWFGGVVSAASWHDLWLEDAFQTYTASLSYESGVSSASAMSDLRDAYFSGPDSVRRPLVWNRWNHPSELRSREISARGAWILHMLARQTGADAFREAVNLFLTWNQFQPVTSDEWVRALEAVTESDYSTFTEAWVAGAGHPELLVRYEGGPDVLRLHVEQVQSGRDVPEAYALELVVEVGTLDGSERFTVHVDERAERFDLPFAADPRYVAVDPDGEWLLESRVDQPASAWVAQLRQATSAHARRTAAHALRDGPPDPALLLAYRAALDAEGDVGVRIAVVEAIGNLPPGAAVERALAAALEDPSPDVREAVMASLAETASTIDAHALALRAAERDPSPHVQAAAVRALARMDAPAALDVARAAMVTPSHDEVIRAAGLHVLGLLFNRAPDEALEQALAHTTPDRPARLRIAGAEILGRSSGRSATERLAALLGDRNPEVARAAITALRSSQREATVLEHFDSIRSPAVRAAVACGGS